MFTATHALQATYTFPVGLTTLWWYAPAQSLNTTFTEFDAQIYAETDGKQQKLGLFK